MGISPAFMQFVRVEWKHRHAIDGEELEESVVVFSCSWE
jgi:hypothetical protein